MARKAKVIGLFGPVLNDGTRKASKEVVRDLSESLERARAGEIVGVGIVEMYRDGSTAAAATGKVDKRAFLGCLVEMLVFEAGRQ